MGKSFELKEYKPLKQKKCKECKTYFQPNKPLKYICSIPCAIAHTKKLKQVKELKEWKKYKRGKEEEMKTLSDYYKDLEKEINQIVRYIDKGHECISSGKKRYQVNAGHLYSVGAFPALRFNLLNIYNQSVDDNLYRGGNGVIYKERIKEVFGVEVAEEIESLKGKHKILDLTIPEVKATIKIARRINRRLKKQTEDQDRPFTTEERISVRRELNEEIGLY